MVKTSGVYMILHIPSGRKYIGSSQEVETRLYNHRMSLCAGDHHCRFLQNVWNKHDRSEFTFDLLEECPIEELLELEQTYMDCVPATLLLNGRPLAASNRGFKNTPETIQKMSIAAVRVAADPHERQIRSERAKRQHAEGRLGVNTYTDKSRRILSDKAKSNGAASRLTQEHRERSGKTRTGMKYRRTDASH